MRIAVVGNCYVEAIAGCLRLLLPGAEVTPFWARADRAEEAKAFYASLGAFDVVCGHRAASGDLARTAREAGARRFIQLPALVFTGFQPDNVMIGALRGPMGHCHSAIAVSAFLLGLPEARAQGLFNSFVYASLGYFDRFAQERERLLRSAASLDFDLRADFEAWPRPFMHDVSHPAFPTHVSVARILARRLSDEVREVDWSDPAVVAAADHTKFNALWPVYPEIARRLGMPEQPLVFRFEGRLRQELSLEEFIARSYELYAGADPALLTRAVEPEMAVLSELFAYV
ncbi:MAG: WcbI family polysaccharide biosynthesis putative acetyltransferase [Roseococcus sp.]